MQYWGITDRGAVRLQNQDAFTIHPQSDGRVLVVVCDGMGGARAGNVASEMTVALFTAAFDSIVGNDDQRLGQAAIQANDQVFHRAITDDDCAGMGTTLVTALIGEKQATLLNVGDSRAYLINDSGIRQITRDHSVVEDLVSSGKLSREEARNHPRKNLITRALGCEPQLRADLFHIDVVPGDHLLLCSDGLSNLLAEQEILYEVIHGGESSTCCQRLLDIAMHRGAPDNVTVVLVRC